MGHLWNPARFTLGNLGRITNLSTDSGKDVVTKHPYAVILLNRSNVDIDLGNKLLEKAQYRIAADGAANSYLDNKRAIPDGFACLDAICGDMDSISEESYSLYSKNPNISIIVDTDQYSTDFMKCLRHASEEADGILESYEALYEQQWGLKRERIPALDVVVLGGLDGRADQAFSQIHHLYLASEDFSLTLGDVYLLADKSIMFLLQKGMNIIQTPVKPGFLTENVGIIPIGKQSRITTKGLEWDVTDWSTEFGGQISTSNHIKAKIVRVKTTERVLFTVELAEMEVLTPSEVSEKKNEIDEKGGVGVKGREKLDVEDDSSSGNKGRKEREKEEAEGRNEEESVRQSSKNGEERIGKENSEPQSKKRRLAS